MHERESQPITALPSEMHHSTGPLTLSVDCGGGSIKAAVCAPDGALVSTSRRIPVTYPFTVNSWLDILAQLSKEATLAGLTVSRLSVGMPGMIRSGFVIFTPHYIRQNGPHTEILDTLNSQWTGLDANTRLRDRLGVPAKVVNDSEMHGAALISGTGLEVTLTFGTGLGSAHFNDGALQAHLELSHAQFIENTTYDQYIGDHIRQQIGDYSWSKRVVEVVEKLFPVFRWDTIYVGGGNAHNLTTDSLQQLSSMGPSVRVVANRVALSGGPALW